jgi:Mg-chelatase subunit ChlD
MSRSAFRSCRRLALLAAVGAVLGLAVPRVVADEKQPVTKKPRIEVVFCLDTTGSMTGLIEGAKQKIWSISNQIAGGKPAPDLKIGLVAYRDRGDDYITKVIDLTDDLDAIHGQLKGFKAAGGGDFPESVNQALDDAVNRIKWSTDKDTLRILFLVGDAPPHMDYPDDVKYPVTCKKACEKAIIINTIQCGDHPDCRKAWQDICRKAEGTYVQIPADGGRVQVVATPFDKDLNAINTEMAKTTLVYGSREQQRADGTKAHSAARLAAPVAADRAAFNAKSGRVASYDLLDNIKQGKVKLETLKKDELPEEMQKMTLTEQKAHLEKLDKRRAELSKRALELDKKRSEFINKKLAEAKESGKSVFDNEVLQTLRQQAKKYHIEY